jgi:hypothetical protein
MSVSDALSAAFSLVSSRPLDTARLPVTFVAVCNRMAAATGGSSEGAMYCLLGAFSSCAGAGSTMVAGVSRSRLNFLAVEVCDSVVEHNSVSLFVAAALDDACRKCGKAPTSVTDFCWTLLPSTLQVGR